MKNVNVYYWTQETNFGDLLNVELCRKLFNINPIETVPDDCDAVFIGSVLDVFLNRWGKRFTRRYRDNIKKTPVKIWGSGFIRRRIFRLPEIFSRRAEVYAVRGSISRDRLQTILKSDLTDIAVGDPGLLASRLIDSRAEKRWTVGIIPHHTELDLPIWEYLESYIPHSTVIRVDETVESTLRKIAACDTILSSSLHGLIVADSFHIPNARLVASDRLWGGDYKFNDYYSAFGLSQHRKIDINTQTVDKALIQSVISSYAITESAVDAICSELIRTFPYTTPRPVPQRNRYLR